MNIQTVTIHKTDDASFDDYCEAFYNKDPEFVATVNSHNDTAHEFRVTGHVSQYDQEELNGWLAGRYGSCHPSILLNDLARGGHIPRGDYLITVSW